MVAVVLATQALRWWCISTLGRRWNTRIVVIPGMPLVDRGPYRWLRHPNYVAVVVEGDRVADGAHGVAHRRDVHRAERDLATSADPGRGGCALASADPRRFPSRRTRRPRRGA